MAQYLRFIAAIAAALIVPTAAAAASRIEFGAGIARASTNGDGTWYQSRFQHSMNTSAPAFMVGASGDLSPRLAWHLDFVSLGHYAVDSLDTPNDANYAPDSPTGCNGACLPLAHYHGSGSVYGLAGTLEAHSDGPWRLGLELGPFLYRESWAVSVPDWYPSVQTGPSTFTAGPVSPVNYSQAQWRLGGVVGLSLTHHGLGLRLRYFADGASFPGHGADGWPPLWHSHIVLMVTESY